MDKQANLRIEGNRLVECVGYYSRTITIPDGIAIIGEDAFDGCSDLTEIILPKTLVTIEDGAFANCEGLKSIVIPEGVTEIGNRAFFGCESLREIKLPKTLVHIGGGAFWGCYILKEVELPEGLRSIYGAAFQQCGLVHIEIPNTVTELLGAFAFCDRLKTVVIPDSVAIVGASMFEACENLTEVTLFATVNKIESYSFMSCKKLKCIRFNGTKAQWKAIVKEKNWKKGSKFKVLCTDGKIGSLFA